MGFSFLRFPGTGGGFWRSIPLSGERSHLTFPQTSRTLPEPCTATGGGGRGSAARCLPGLPPPSLPPARGRSVAALAPSARSPRPPARCEAARGAALGTAPARLSRACSLTAEKPKRGKKKRKKKKNPTLRASGAADTTPAGEQRRRQQRRGCASPHAWAPSAPGAAAGRAAAAAAAAEHRPGGAEGPGRAAGERRCGFISARAAAAGERGAGTAPRGDGRSRRRG